MSKGEIENEDSSKSIEELAREAMDAIKESERLNKRKERELIEAEAKIREEQLKEEVRRKIRDKLRMEKKMESKPEEQEQKPGSLLKWKNSDKKGIKYEGEHNEKTLFIIKRGILLYHLYIVNSDVISESWRKKGHTSLVLETLKDKADNILKKSINKKPK